MIKLDKEFQDLKPKSIIVDGKLHKKLKSHCRSRALKIGSIVEELIDLYLTDPHSIVKLIENKRRFNDE